MRSQNDQVGLKTTTLIVFRPGCVCIVFVVSPFANTTYDKPKKFCRPAQLLLFFLPPGAGGGRLADPPGAGAARIFSGKFRKTFKRRVAFSGPAWYN